MNNLSWFLYIADVAESMKTALALTAITGGIIAVFYTMYNLIEREQSPPHIVKIVALLIGAVLLSTFIPRSQTIYMIAASEAGQQIAQTEDGKEMIELVKSKIKETLKSDK